MGFQRSEFLAMISIWKVVISTPKDKGMRTFNGHAILQLLVNGPFLIEDHLPVFTILPFKLFLYRHGSGGNLHREWEAMCVVQGLRVQWEVHSQLLVWRPLLH